MIQGVAATTWAEVHASGASTGSMEGKEQRFGVWGSSLFAASTTSTSTGAVNSMHESYSPLGGGAVLANMATECSARTAIVIADDETFRWLAEWRPGVDVEALRSRAVFPDEGAGRKG